MWTRWNTPGSHLRNQNKHKNKKSINNKGTNKEIPSVDEMEQAWPGGGGGYFLVKDEELCRWMGSHFHIWTDYNGVTFLACFRRITRMGSQIFGIFGIRKFW